MTLTPTEQTLLQSAMDDLALTTVGQVQWTAATYADRTKTRWYKALTKLHQLQGTPPPPTTKPAQPGLLPTALSEDR